MELPAIRTAASRYLIVDGIRTHYFDGGDGPPVVLFHGGGFGSRTELSWAGNIDALAQRYRVIAPDWLGLGRTDKVHDFRGKYHRMINHMARFLEVMNLPDAHFIGNSMGATLIAARVANRDHRFRPRSMVLVGGGGFVPNNEYRRALADYDCTIPGMVKQLQSVFADPKWWTDEAYVRQRYEWSIEPGAWESWAARRFRAPHLPPVEDEFGTPDNLPYQNIACPVLVIAGGADKLRLPDYGQKLVARIPRGRLYVFPNAGHSPNIECAEQFNKIVLTFLDRVSVAPKAPVPQQAQMVSE